MEMLRLSDLDPLEVPPRRRRDLRSLSRAVTAREDNLQSCVLPRHVRHGGGGGHADPPSRPVSPGGIHPRSLRADEGTSDGSKSEKQDSSCFGSEILKQWM